MYSDLLMPPLDRDIREVVEGIFENMLNLRLTSDRGELDLSDKCLQAIVEFKGSWVGSVMLCSDEEQARRFASRFLALPEEQLSDQLVADVLGEIANMIAGNLKSVFARDLRLSLAQVTNDPSLVNQAFPPVIEDEVRFNGVDGPFCVIVRAIPSVPRLLSKTGLCQ